MSFITHLLQVKGRDVWSVKPETPVYDALKLMAEKNIGAVLVLEGERLAGVFSERDYARKVILMGKSSKETPVREVMSTTTYTVTPDQSIEDCMALMTARRIRHLPVLESGRLIGMISIGDVVKAIIADRETTIRDLENYIRGG
ncbi:MAG: CBS domain-containing protein [Planctomycetales bacterium]|nr:CBS domain-containing protein [Planctomycetales bacterium]